MCIIMIKPLGQQLPKKEIFEEMFINNPHGGGVAYSDINGGKVVYKKGFMEFEGWYNYILGIKDVENKTIVTHTRITTHGGTCQELTHPFVISNKLKDMQVLEGEEDMIVFHNGIIHCNNIPKNYKGSDTTFYIQNQIYNRYKYDKNFIDKKKTQDRILKDITSKMVFLEEFGKYTKLGKFIEDEGIFYSNGSYEPYDYSQYYTGTTYHKTNSWKTSTPYYTPLLDSVDDDMTYGRELFFDEFIMIDGIRVYGNDEELYLTEDGVYMFTPDTYAPIRVANEAYIERVDGKVDMIQFDWLVDYDTAFELF